METVISEKKTNHKNSINDAEAAFITVLKVLKRKTCFLTFLKIKEKLNIGPRINFRSCKKCSSQFFCIEHS